MRNHMYEYMNILTVVSYGIGELDHHWFRCHLFDAKSLPEPMLTWGKLDPKKQTLIEF